MAKKTPKIIAQAGQQLQMTCPITGYPIFNINWEKGLFLPRLFKFILYKLHVFMFKVQNKIPKKKNHCF